MRRGVDDRDDAAVLVGCILDVGLPRDGRRAIRWIRPRGLGGICLPVLVRSVQGALILFRFANAALARPVECQRGTDWRNAGDKSQVIPR